ncbi:MAG: zinc ABC transporter solute-binding protein, partial [Anaerolineaceae bacterium]|nr:zinc ABC transporter solute-binding protein [Anaerolineaceae bacterium]
MKKNFITVIVLAIALVVLAACSPATKPSSMPVDGKPRVLAVETFLADIAQNVAGDRLTVESLLPLGLDPHAFEPAPQDVARISDSDVLIINGGGFEAWLDKTMANAGGQHRLVDASSGVTARTAREGEEAVMSPEERADQVCFDWPNTVPTEKKQAGADAAGAVDLHDEAAAGGEHAHQAELINILLTTLSDGTNGGFLRVHAEEAVDYLFAAGPGTMTLRAGDGSSLEAEQTFKLNCSELSTGMIVEL